MIISAGGRPETENRISLHLYSAGASGLRVVHCAQWLLAIQLDNDRVFYNAPGTVHWSEWQEDNKRRCESVLKSTMFDGVGEDRPVTNMDSSLVGMFERKRFLDLIYKFMFYDGLHTSIIRYQQFDAIQASLRRIEKKDKAGKHLGGTIWYKSGDYVDLTIAMLAKAIRLQPYKISPLVFIVTDRIEIIPIIQKAFLNCGQVVKQARTGNDLITLLKDQDNRNIVSTFDKILKMTKAKSLIDSAEIFVLIDDTQSYSLASVVTKIRSTLPQACIINFTARPEAEKEDGTTRVPSDIIHQYALKESSLLIVQEAPMQYSLTHEEAVRLFKDDISKILSGSLSGSKNCVSQALEKIAARIANKIQPFITRDWKNDPDKNLTLENAIEEVMMSCNESGIRIVFDDFDAILKECVGAARARL
jgi:type I site-specific restriction-modification system R (restriction) subunit